MNYELDSPEKIADHFSTITRQRVSQLLKKFTRQGNTKAVESIKRAKAILKERRHTDKRGCTLAEFEKARSVWHSVIDRVGRHPAYLDCTVEWRGEVDFRTWAVKQIGFSEEGWELDKDILVKGNRVYGPDTCVFVPSELNVVLSGCYKAKRRGPYPIGVCFNKGSGTFVAQMNKEYGSLDKYLGSFRTVEEAFACYKEAKEAKIRRLADKWKNRIDPRAYEALVNRTVEWDD